LELDMSTIHPPNALLLRKFIGTAKGPDGTQFEMSLVNGIIPAVKNETTGKTWTMNWEELVKLAVAEGVSEP
jgi:hypothetical protein